MKTGLKIIDLLDSFISEICEENAVQVDSDSGRNYVL